MLTEHGRTVVHLTLLNRSRSRIFLLEPWQLFPTHIFGPSLFQLKQDGHYLPFLGPMAKVRATPAKDLSPLAPGSSLRGQQDISDLYPFPAGTSQYTLTYQAFVATAQPTHFVQVRSEPLTFTLSR